MIISDFKAFVGQHCETTATGSLLRHEDIELSEPMLFGLGSGLGYIFWNMRNMNIPFIGGRIKPDLLTENICQKLFLKLDVFETSSPMRAWNHVATQIKAHKPVGLKLDCYHLEYFRRKFHFAGHYVAMYGYDEDRAYLVDTKQQGGKVRSSLSSLEKARNEKGPMSSRNRSFVISRTLRPFDLKSAIRSAVRQNTADYLNPPIANFGYRGIEKTSTAIKKWFRESKDVKGDFQMTAMLMERAGTGGSLFRNLYRDFLAESAALLESTMLLKAHDAFAQIAVNWKVLSDLFFQIGATGQTAILNQASELLLEISVLEKSAMTMLSDFGAEH